MSAELRKYHLERVDTKLQADGYSPTTIKNTITTVQGVLGWAVEFEMIDMTPLPKYKKPAARCRNRVITRKNLALSCVTATATSGDSLMALRLTGCRPGELRT